MKIPADDPRLAAYALGHLGEKERAELEALLAEDEEARAEVEAIRELVESLTECLGEEPCPELRPVQRDLIERIAAQPPPIAEALLLARPVALYLFVVLLVMVPLLGLIAPHFGVMFDDLLEGVPLPNLTQLVLWAGDFCQRYGVVLVLGAAALLFASNVAARRASRQYGGRRPESAYPWAQSLMEGWVQSAVVVTLAFGVGGVVMGLFLPNITLVDCLGGGGGGGGGGWSLWPGSGRHAPDSHMCRAPNEVPAAVVPRAQGAEQDEGGFDGWGADEEKEGKQTAFAPSRRSRKRRLAKTPQPAGKAEREELADWLSGGRRLKSNGEAKPQALGDRLIRGRAGQGGGEFGGMLGRESDDAAAVPDARAMSAKGGRSAGAPTLPPSAKDKTALDFGAAAAVHGLGDVRRNGKPPARPRPPASPQAPAPGDGRLAEGRKAVEPAVPRAEAPPAPEKDGSEESRPRPKAPPLSVNPFVLTARDRLSTFSLESDTASYAMTRRHIRSGYRPPPAIVRMEEFVNAFNYNYPRQAERTFTVHAAAAPAPFGPDLVLLRVGVKGKVLGRDGRRAAHLVYVVDASGSMGRDDRMPLVKYALSMLVDQLDERDRVTLVAYGTQPRLLLEAVSAAEKAMIRDAVEAIECGASTNMLAGIELGYQLAARHFRADENNRVILCSDGVANVGPSDAGALLAKVDLCRKQGITFTSVGVGAGSYDDRMLEELANKGDGNYVFIDTPKEARRLFAENMSATLQTIAKDVKIQVEFNPERVRRYRLIGYENRAVADKDFRNDAVDAGEIGSGQAATALYELELLPGAPDRPADLGAVYVRYRNLDTDEVEEISARLPTALVRERTPETDPHFFLAACVAEFAEILRGCEHARTGSLEALEQLLIRTSNALPLDERTQELLLLVQQAQGLPQAD